MENNLKIIQTPTRPTPHENLMKSLQGVTQRQLISGEGGNVWKYDLMELQGITNIDIAIKANKIFLAKNQMGQETIEKLTCAILVAFCDTIKVTSEKPDGFEILEMATLFLETYTHESISDLILCLKMVKQGKFGKIYNRFDLAVFNLFWKQYLEFKYEELENRHNRQKLEGSGAVNTQEHTQSIIQEKREREKLKKDYQEKVQQHFMIKEVIEKRLGDKNE